MKVQEYIAIQKYCEILKIISKDYLEYLKHSQVEEN